MGRGRYIGTTPQQLTKEDKEFVKLIESGSKKSSAFRTAYPNHSAVQKWFLSEPGSPDRQRAAFLVVEAAKNKLQAKYMQGAIVSYQASMDRFSDLSLAAATDLVQNARSEKVRADLAIEGIRHKIGSPMVKAMIQEEKTVYLTFGEKPKDREPSGREVIEGDVS